jgi:hypothetical protein
VFRAAETLLPAAGPSGARSVRAYAAHDGAQGTEYDLDIERERPGLYVAEI